MCKLYIRIHTYINTYTHIYIQRYIRTYIHTYRKILHFRQHIIVSFNFFISPVIHFDLEKKEQWSYFICMYVCMYVCMHAFVCYMYCMYDYKPVVSVSLRILRCIFRAAAFSVLSFPFECTYVCIYFSICSKYVCMYAFMRVSTCIIYSNEE